MTKRRILCKNFIKTSKLTLIQGFVLEKKIFFYHLLTKELSLKQENKNK